MEIRKLYESGQFPYHMVVEGINGGFSKFYIIPARRITEADLSPLPFYLPKGKNGKEAAPYVYQMYGFTKVL